VTKVKDIMKPKQSNSEHQEIASLVHAKREEHNASIIGVVDSKDCFKSAIVKWKKIVH
jgi:hypothetical protein